MHKNVGVSCGQKEDLEKYGEEGSKEGVGRCDRRTEKGLSGNQGSGSKHKVRRWIRIKCDATRYIHV